MWYPEQDASFCRNSYPFAICNLLTTFLVRIFPSPTPYSPIRSKLGRASSFYYPDVYGDEDLSQIILGTRFASSANGRCSAVRYKLQTPVDRWLPKFS